MLRLATASSGLTADAARRRCAAPVCLACCAASGKQTANRPSARTRAPLDMREVKTRSPQTLVKILRKWQPVPFSMLSGALQRNAKHEARLSNISGYLLHVRDGEPEILRFAQNDKKGAY